MKTLQDVKKRRLGEGEMMKKSVFQFCQASRTFFLSMTLFPSLLHSTFPKFIPHAKTASSLGKLSFNTHVFLRAEALQTIKILVCESSWLLRPPGIQAAKTELSEAWLCHISKFKVLAGTPRV